MDTSHDYYAVLGVNSQASTSAIKAAFKKLALQYHPDVYKGEDAQQRMRHLLQAYQTLSDPVARKAYDDRHLGMHSTTAPRFVDRREEQAHKTASTQGQYAFPDLRLSRHAPLLLTIDAIEYQLTTEQAERLLWEGIVRDVMPHSVTNALSASYCCQRCRHRWTAPVAAGLPLTCPACHAQDWAEYLLLRCMHCQAVFVSKEIRDPLRGNTLYYPYELFPLCPHCRRSQWCFAENARVAHLRAVAARRRAILLSSVLGVCLILVVLIVFVLLR